MKVNPERFVLILNVTVRRRSCFCFVFKLALAAQKCQAGPCAIVNYHKVLYGCILYHITHH